MQEVEVGQVEVVEEEGEAQIQQDPLGQGEQVVQVSL